MKLKFCKAVAATAMFPAEPSLRLAERMALFWHTHPDLPAFSSLSTYDKAAQIMTATGLDLTAIGAASDYIAAIEARRKAKASPLVAGAAPRK